MSIEKVSPLKAAFAKMVEASKESELHYNNPVPQSKITQQALYWSSIDATREFELALEEFCKLPDSVRISFVENEAQVFFEIFEKSNGLLASKNTTKISKLFTPELEDVVFRELEKFSSEEVYTQTLTAALIVQGGDFLSSQHLDRLWVALKARRALDELEVDVDPNVRAAKSKYSYGPGAHLIPFFFSAKNSSKIVQEESAAMIRPGFKRPWHFWKEQTKSSLFWKPPCEDRFSVSISVSAAEFFFEGKVKERAMSEGCDPAVLDMLIPQWEGSVSNLIVAAQNLSSD